MPASTRLPAPSGLLDIAGCAASVACALHCIALPVFLISYPALPLRALRAPWAEWTFVLLSLVLGLWSFGPSAASREGRAPLALFLAGGATLLTVRTLAPEHAPNVERLGLLTGAVLLVSAHLLNHARLRHRCGCAVCEPNESATDVVF
jgi:CDP-diglyceride synthetase